MGDREKRAREVLAKGYLDPFARAEIQAAVPGVMIAAATTVEAMLAFSDAERLAQSEASDGVGWIVGNSDGTQWRTWGAFGSEWTDERNKATRYHRREDAEAVHEGDEDAWRVEQYATASPKAASDAGAGLREALEPFLHAAEPIIHNDRERWQPDEWTKRLNAITVGQFRALHAAAPKVASDVGAGLDWAALGHEYAEKALSGGGPRVSSPQYALSGAFTSMACEIERLRALSTTTDATDAVRVADGFKLVPEEPTDAMCRAWGRSSLLTQYTQAEIDALSDDHAEALAAELDWSAMLAASPTSPSLDTPRAGDAK